MKIYFAALTILLISNSTFSQKKGFSELNYAKTSLEDVVKQLGASIPDTSQEYKDYYLRISNQYNKAKANYEAYKGSMKDCILNNNSQNKIKKCLQTSTLNIENNLDSLQLYLARIYILYNLHHPPSASIGNTTKNTSALTPDVISKIVDALLDAGIKIWDAIQKKNKQFKDDYLAQIQSKDYVLGDFDVLVKQGATKK